MDVLSSRVILRPADPDRSRSFYRDVLGLAVYREFGDPDSPSQVFFLGNGFLEVSGHGDGGGSGEVFLWLQVRDVEQEHRSEEHTFELQSRGHLVCRLLLEKKNINAPDQPSELRMSR